MYKVEDLRRLELEPTNICQARCPQCTRTPTDGSINKTLNDQLELDILKTQISPEFWRNLTNIEFNGTTGDCMAHQGILEMLEFITASSNAPITIHTNGGLGTTAKWQALAKILGSNDKVIFGIDGLEDTHQLYRIGVDFNLVIKHAKAFIDAGGQAHWQYIPFKHNEHQIETARKLSEELGFRRFFLRRSGRFNSTGYLDVFVDGTISHRIEQTSISTGMMKESEQRNIKTAEIKCEAVDTNWVAIYADGTVWPCCHLMGQHRTSHFGISKLINKKIIEVIGDYSHIDLHNHTLDAIISSDVFQNKYTNSFTSKHPIPVCLSECGGGSIYKAPN